MAGRPRRGDRARLQGSRPRGPSEAETRFSFAGLADLLADVVDDVLPELPPVQRRALEAALLLGESEVRADDRAVAAAFLGALRLLAGDGPVCLAVDDIQWLDAASLAALRYALARLEREPVAALLAVRGDPPAWLRRAVPEERLRTVEVGGLSVGAMHELLRARLDATFPRPTLIRIWETSGGNPFFALELAGALLRRGGSLASGRGAPDPSGPRRAPARSASTASAQRRSRSRGPSRRSPIRPCRSSRSVVGAQFDAGLAEALGARILELDGERLRFTHPLLGSAAVAHAASVGPTFAARAPRGDRSDAGGASPASRARDDGAGPRDCRDARGGGAIGAGARRAGCGCRTGGAGTETDADRRRRGRPAASLPRSDDARRRRRHRPGDRAARARAQTRHRSVASGPPSSSSSPTCRTIRGR